MSCEARKGAMYNYINLLLIIVTGAVLTPFVIRSLGASQYGLYALMGGILPYVTLLDLGLSRTITRYVSYYRARHDDESESRFMTTAIHIYAVIVVLLLFLGVCVYYHVEAIWGNHFTVDELADVRKMLLITVLTQAVIVPGNAFTAVCYGCGYFAFPRALHPIKYIIRNICVVVLLLCGYKAVALIALEALLNVSMVVATYIYVRRHIGRKHIFSSRHDDYRQVLSYGGWMALYTTTCALQWNIGQIIASMTSSAATVGIVGIGVLLGNMYGYFAETINRMTMPRASQFVKNNPSGADITNEMIGVGRIIAIILGGVLGAFIIMGQDFVVLWAGEMYKPAYDIALIIMSAWTVQLVQEYGFALLEAKGCVKVVSVINFICIFAATILSYFTSVCLGMVGMMGTMAVGTLLVTIINNVYYKRQLQLEVARYFKSVFARMVAVLALCVVVSVVLARYDVVSSSWMWLIFEAVIYVTVYVPIVYVLLLTPGERQILKKYVQRKR